MYHIICGLNTINTHQLEQEVYSVVRIITNLMLQSSLVVLILVISGVFIEIPIVVWLNNQRIKKQSTRKSQQVPTHNPKVETVSS